METYEVRYQIITRFVEAEDFTDAATKFVNIMTEGNTDWGNSLHTLAVTVLVRNKETGVVVERTVRIPPRVPTCIYEDDGTLREGDHNWCEPHDLLQKMGYTQKEDIYTKTVLKVHVCSNCGWIRCTKTRPETESVDRVSFYPPTAATIEWAEFVNTKNCSPIRYLPTSRGMQSVEPITEPKLRSDVPGCLVKNEDGDIYYIRKFPIGTDEWIVLRLNNLDKEVKIISSPFSQTRELGYIRMRMDGEDVVVWNYHPIEDILQVVP